MRPEEVGSEMARQGLTPSAITFLLKEVHSRGSLLRRLGLPDDLIDCFRLCNQQGFFFLQFGADSELVVANKGLKQGCPFASPFYALLASFQIELLHRIAPWLTPDVRAVAASSLFQPWEGPWSPC
eukprot:12886193-Prorocentrum_lima.AAC.1